MNIIPVCARSNVVWCQRTRQNWLCLKFFDRKVSPLLPKVKIKKKKSIASTQSFICTICLRVGLKTCWYNLVPDLDGNFGLKRRCWWTLSTHVWWWFNRNGPQHIKTLPEAVKNIMMAWHGVSYFWCGKPPNVTTIMNNDIKWLLSSPLLFYTPDIRYYTPMLTINVAQWGRIAIQSAKDAVSFLTSGVCWFRLLFSVCLSDKI